DGKLAELNRELTKSVLVYGGKDQQKVDRRKTEESLALKGETAASRVAFQAKNAQVATYCLLDSVNRGAVKLEDIKKEELPPELQKLTLPQQKEYLKKLNEKRVQLNKDVLELDKKRSDYIAKKQAEEAKKGKAGFDGQVLDVLRNQAKRYAIKY